MARKTVTPPAGFSPLFIKSLTPGTPELGDKGAYRGLRLRTQSTGWVFRWYVPPRVITIGAWAEVATPGHVTLEEARTWFRRLKTAHKAGPIELTRVEAELKATLEPKSGPDATRSTTDGTVNAIAEKWLATLQTRRKRPEVAEAVLKNDILPFIGHLPLQVVQPRDCVDVVERVVSGVGRVKNAKGKPRGKAPVHAQKVLSILKQLLAYGGRRENMGSAAALLKADDFGIVTNERDRWLDPEKELPLLWRILEEGKVPDGVSLPEPRTRIALRLLLLTALRSGELRLTRWEDVDLEHAHLVVPVANQKLSPKQAKKARPFIVPLSPTALDLVLQLRAMTEKEPRPDGTLSPWVLSSGRADADGPYTDKSMGHAMRRLWHSHPELKKLPSATPHDLRRSARSYLDRIGVPGVVAEKVLNHSVGRIQRTYQRNDNVEERREALVKLEAFVLSMVKPAASNVAFLATARAQ